jgi:hypothetical protein
MSDYTSTWTEVDGVDDIDSADFSTEFDAIATATATKANKVVPTTTNAIATLSATGDLQDSDIIYSFGEKTITTIGAGGSDESLVAHGLPDDVIDFGFKFIGTVATSDLAVMIRDANDYVVVQPAFGGTSVALAATTPSAGNIRIAVSNNNGSVQNCTVHWWARTRT